MTDTPIDSELVEVLPDPVLVFKSADLTLLWMNSAAENWLQCSLTSKLGRNLAHIAGGFAALETSVRDVAKNGSTIRGHNLYIRFPGLDSAEVSYLIFPYKDNLAVLLSPEISGLGAGSDSDKGQAVGMFGQMLAHELKNPLAGIYGAVQLLEAGIADAADLEITGLIKSEVKRIGRLADKMEDFGINEPSEFDNFNIHTVLRKALLLFQNSNNADIEFLANSDPSLPDVYVNADK
ncbi:MAG: hypothetical protein L3J05_04270, partial [Robiginitomaculum sp.]|nr:hypothetical protein [Robiginitomaculum sp.]